MWRRASKRENGFTLIEVLVGLVVSAILMLVILRFYKHSSKAYNLQEEIAERDQNIRYVVKRLTNVFEQAGSNLPAWDNILVSGSPATSLSIGVNPRGGIQYISSTHSGVNQIPVDSSNMFKEATHILIKYYDPAKASKLLAINTNYNSNGFTNGLREVAGGSDLIRLSSNILAADALRNRDIIYAYKVETYALSGNNFTLMGMVLAENIDTLAFYYYQADKSVASNWGNMKSVAFKVSGRTATPEPALPGDHYRHKTISTNVLFRNKI